MSSISGKSSHRETYLYVGQGLRILGHAPADGDQTVPVGTPSRLLAARSNKLTQGPGPVPPHLMAQARAPLVAPSQPAPPRLENGPAMPPVPYQDDEIRPATPLHATVQADEISPATPLREAEQDDDKSYTESILPLYESMERPLPPNTTVKEREIPASARTSIETANSQDKGNLGVAISTWSTNESDRPAYRRAKLAIKAKLKTAKLNPQNGFKRFTSIFKRT